jgi:hypothetical protein
MRPDKTVHIESRYDSPRFWNISRITRIDHEAHASVFVTAAKIFMPQISMMMCRVCAVLNYKSKSRLLGTHLGKGAQARLPLTDYISGIGKRLNLNLFLKLAVKRVLVSCLITIAMLESCMCTSVDFKVPKLGPRLHHEHKAPQTIESLIIGGRKRTRSGL